MDVLSIAAAYKSPKPANVGRGVAMGYRGPGGGNTSLKISLNPDGSIVIQTALFEQGTGTYTTLRQITAEELSCNPDEIQIEVLDTDSGVPFDSGIGGSRGTRVATGVAFQAAKAARDELLALAEKLLGWEKADIQLLGKILVNKKTERVAQRHDKRDNNGGGLSPAILRLRWSWPAVRAHRLHQLSCPKADRKNKRECGPRVKLRPIPRNGVSGNFWNPAQRKQAGRREK